MMISPADVVIRLGVAMALAALVGFERERKEQAAGLRTHALVGLGACLFMIVSAFGFSDVLDTPHVALDPSRIAAQVVTGIGFLGGGAIVFQHEMVRGLTTAASIWAVAAVGLAVGGGMYLAAVFATALSLIILIVMKIMETRLEIKHRPQTIHVVFDPGGVALSAIVGALEDLGVDARNVSVCAEDDLRHVDIGPAEGDKVEEALEKLVALPGVRKASTGRLP